MLNTKALCASFTGLMLAGVALGQEHGRPWKYHVIDDSSRGADGARLADANGDGLPDIATGWEEGGVVKVYLNPGPGKAGQAWPSVVVGQEKDPEDAVLVDVDGDGALDVVSCHEGQTRTAVVHWAPKDKARYLDAAAWTSEPFPALDGKQMWMFCLPVEKGLVFGSKGHYGTESRRGPQVPASLGLLQAPADRRNLAAWKWTQWSDAAWIMSLVSADMNGDGRPDVLVSDRFGPDAGVKWFENTGGTGVWAPHVLTHLDDQVLFLTPFTTPAGATEVVAAMKKEIVWIGADGAVREHIPVPDWAGEGKAVSAGDVDGDGVADLVVTCERATTKRGVNKSGVFWLKRTAGGWAAHDISGEPGIKYDLCPLIDLDGDGDLDVLTTEERESGKGKRGLGLIWYENPTR